MKKFLIALGIISLISITEVLAEDWKYLGVFSAPRSYDYKHDSLILNHLRPFNRPGNNLRYFNAVSYTHLDVYKRQPQDNGEGRAVMGITPHMDRKNVSFIEAARLSYDRCAFILAQIIGGLQQIFTCLLYTSPLPGCQEEMRGHGQKQYIKQPSRLLPM